MASGLLEVKGSIDLTQFWPLGSSDADTTKIKVDVGPTSFRFREDAASPFKVTKVFNNAYVVGQGRKKAIDANGRITVRLQGIDAPELHYRPKAELKPSQQSKKQREVYLKWNCDYRQPLAETATIALFKFLSKAGPSPVKCLVCAAVDEPNEVFDMYGRFVGDIFIWISAVDYRVNLWLARNGWGLPAFYNSMANVEIERLQDAGRKARDEGKGVWPKLATRAGSLDFACQYRDPRTRPPPASDKGLVVLPKLFRRLATYAVNRRAKMVSGNFKSYLQLKKDECYTTTDFLSQGVASTTRLLHEFVTTGGKILAKPQELVFKEKPSTLVKESGGKILRW
jgi:endonuclease YncB( thermonuclease family)